MIGAIDVGGTKIAAGLVADGRVILQREVPTSAALLYDAALQHIARMLKEMAGEAGTALEGIGVGLTGRVEGAARRIGRNDFLKDWEGHDLTGDLERIFQVSAAIENDADAVALAEAAWGAGKGVSRLIYVTVSTGIGGGIVLNGKLYRGVEGCHPEIGHHVIDPAGPACFCGARGCWERMASGTALLDWAMANVPEAQGYPDLDARGICDLAENGVDWARQAVQREGFYLGTGLANLAALFAPDRISLGGGLMRRWRLFEPYALQVIRQNCGLIPLEKIKISRVELGDEAPLIGAAQVWVHAQPK